jgi:hypothetical protein
MNCDGPINVCNQNAAEQAKKALELEKLTKSLGQIHVGKKDNVNHLEHHFVAQQA